MSLGGSGVSIGGVGSLRAMGSLLFPLLDIIFIPLGFPLLDIYSNYSTQLIPVDEMNHKVTWIFVPTEYHPEISYKSFFFTLQ